MLDPEGQPLKEFNLYKQSHGLYDLGRVRGFKALCVDKVRVLPFIAYCSVFILQFDFASVYS